MKGGAYGKDKHDRARRECGIAEPFARSECS